ncbi:GntR family transcriptional regulator [Rhodococcus globerulus]|uniref:GntR family transcriptional regulator n=1 Tax=Rhodococcus globerulus TaxID=33008 RepID=A0ABU4C5E9_RHOGO|nr:GntR family transcriptional regulator [Rhodococcus globerulus]MDV6271731.1 GntR family transcriptional regulator [Rhodococcus globerulus]
MASSSHTSELHRSPLGNQIADTLRRDIMLGVLRPGTRVSQQEVCERFGTSRMPVRDALRILVEDGLMSVDSTRRIVVAPLSREDLLDAFTIEGLLTGMATERASRRAEPAALEELQGLQNRMIQAAEQGDLSSMVELNWTFHRRINRMAGSRKLLVAIRKVSVDLPRDYLSQVPDWSERSIAEHTEILDAMKNRRHVSARNLMAEHVVESGRGLIKYLESVGVELD